MRAENEDRIAGMPVIRGAGAVPEAWWDDAAKTLVANVGQRGYPCHFGTAALARGELYATFFDTAAQLAPALSGFLELSRPYPRQRMVLAAFRRPEETERDERWYAEEFWRVLQALHDADEKAWPDQLPPSPEHSKWEFSYWGVPMFVFSGAPTYRRRLSRNLGPGLVLLFQPRNVFTGVEGGTPGGVRARQLIRGRLADWDTAPAHPDLGDYGDPSNHEWRQYFIPDDDGRLHQRCPLHLSTGAPDGDAGPHRPA